MRHAYLDTVLLIERLHRYYLEVVKIDLDRRNIQDINNVQALILFNIGEDEMTVGELTVRGYYLGSNVSYNVKKMTENNYIIQEKSPHDKRSIRVKLSEKGLVLHKMLKEQFDRQIASLSPTTLSDTDLTPLNDMLRKLERFWTSLMKY
ncbi:MAG: MarR family transcriptional regulator [Alphaproteobacteria bacterium]|nr:MarR family transcriptional regulator [Alphaproteobacteria bacterium]